MTQESLLTNGTVDHYLEYLACRVDDLLRFTFLHILYREGQFSYLAFRWRGRERKEALVFNTKHSLTRHVAFLEYFQDKIQKRMLLQHGCTPAISLNSLTTLDKTCGVTMTWVTTCFETGIGHTIL